MTIELARPIEFRMAFEPRDQTEARVLAKVAVDSRFFNVKSEAEALVIMMVGRELGLTAMQALRGIYIVQGRPVVASDTIVAAIMMSGLAEYWQPLEATPERCTIETKRKGAIAPVRQTWTIEDAKRAGLASKDIWKSYPSEMLNHRCAATLGRRVYSDVLLGCYVQGELDDPPSTPAAPDAPQIIEQRSSPPRISPRGDGAVPQSVLDAIDELGGEITVDQAAAVFCGLRASLAADDVPLAQDALANAARCKSAQLKRAIVATLIGDINRAKSTSELADVLTMSQAIIPTGTPAYQQISAAYNARHAQLTPPEPPSGGGSPRPTHTEDTEAAAEREAIAGGSAGAVATTEHARFLDGLAGKMDAKEHAVNWIADKEETFELPTDEITRLAIEQLCPRFYASPNLVTNALRIARNKRSSRAA